MHEFRKINTSVWHSQKFTKLPIEAKLFYLYCLTAPQGNSVGCYKNPIGYIMTDLGYDDSDTVKQIIDTVCRSGLIRYHAPESTVFIERWFEFNKADNPKHALKLIGDIEKIPYRKFAAEAAQGLLRLIEGKEWEISPSLNKRLHTVSSAGHTETKTETETETFFEKNQTPPPDVSPPKPTKPDPVNFDNDFEQFFKNWVGHEMPKGEKATAKKSYHQARKEGVSHETIIASRDAYLGQCRRFDSKSKHASTWLNARNKAKWSVDADDDASHTSAPKPARHDASPLANAHAQALADPLRPSQPSFGLEPTGLEDDIPDFVPSDNPRDV